MHTTLGIRIARFRTQLTPGALWQRPFVRNVAVVAGGTAVAQAITVAFSPVITRLYGPEAFGLLGAFTSVVSILTAIASLCYPYAIVLPPEDEDGLRLLHLSLAVAVIMASLVAAIAVPFRDRIASLLGLETVAPYLLLVPIVVLLSAMSQAYDQWLIRKKLFRTSSGIAVAQALVVNAAKIGAGIGAPGAGALIAIASGGYGLHALLARWASRATPQCVRSERGPGWGLTDERMRSLAHEYRDFPLYRTPQIALNTFSRNLPVLMLTALFGPTVAGLYALGQRVLSLPATVISQAVGKVFEQRIAESAYQQRRLQPVLIKTTIGLAAIGLVPFGLVIAYGPSLFGLVFGPDWHTTGVYARWMALWLFFGFINVPSVKTVPLLSLQGHLLVLEVGTVLARVAGVVLGALVFHDAATAVALFSTAGTLSYISLIVAVIWLSGRRSSRYEPVADMPSVRGRDGQ
jgi:O-antigen/teichoic acid export membrane protein